MISVKAVLYLVCCNFVLITCFCTRGFDERFRPFINVVTHQTVNRRYYKYPVWFNAKSGGNFVIDDVDRTGILVPASGIYVIFAISRGISGSFLQVRQRRINQSFILIEQPIVERGTTVCGLVSNLKVGDRLSVGFADAESSRLPHLQMFAYLLNLSS